MNDSSDTRVEELDNNAASIYKSGLDNDIRIHRSLSGTDQIRLRSMYSVATPQLCVEEGKTSVII